MNKDFNYGFVKRGDPMFKQVLLFAILTLTFILNINESSAESFQLEGNGAFYYNKNPEKDYALAEFLEKYSIYDFSVAYYFHEVNIEAKPLKDAAFLQKEGYIKFSGKKGNIEITDGNRDMYALGVEAKLVLQEIPFFIILGYERGKTDADLSNYIYSDYHTHSVSNNYSGELGYYITDGFAASLMYYRLYDDFRGLYFAPDDGIKSETNGFGINLKYVIRISDQKSLVLEGFYIREYTSSDDSYYDTVWNDRENMCKFSADFFIIPQLSLGLCIGINNDNVIRRNGDIYKAEITAFPVQNIGISATYGIFITYYDDDIFDTMNSNQKEITIKITGRI